MQWMTRDSQPGELEWWFVDRFVKSTSRICRTVSIDTRSIVGDPINLGGRYRFNSWLPDVGLGFGYSRIGCYPLDIGAADDWRNVVKLTRALVTSNLMLSHLRGEPIQLSERPSLIHALAWLLSLSEKEVR